MDFSKVSKAIFNITCFTLIFIGIFFHLQGMNWHQGANLHPDEYGLTNTLTQLRLPSSISEYFNTRVSPLSPYQKYDLAGQVMADGPDNRMRWGQWPIILIRSMAEATGNTGYDEIRMLGRGLSALADLFSILLIFLIGKRLYNFEVGLLAAALSSLAVMQIQQSHFMTVDNFGVLFTTLTMYAAAVITQTPPVIRPPQDLAAPGSQGLFYRVNRQAIRWYILFGVGFGMAMSTKINLLPLGGMILIAAFISIADLKLRSRSDLGRIVLIAFMLLCIAGACTLLTFRVTQPMSFRANTGDTSIFTLTPNSDWVESMKVAQQESNGDGGGPPAEQWTSRPAILFPLMNMVVWGMGVPLGVAGWAGFLAALWQMVRYGKNWRSHLLIVVWTGGYFLFMGTRWVKSIRYFLPIYPFLCLLAAWGLLALFRWARARETKPDLSWIQKRAGSFLAVIALLLVAGGTLTWATAFTNAVYRQDHTRIQASKWIYQNIPAPFHLGMQVNGGVEYIPIGVPDGQQISRENPYSHPFTSPSDGHLATITIPHIRNSGIDPSAIHITISTDPEGKQPIDQVEVQVPPAGSNDRGVELQANFQGAELLKGKTYYLQAGALSNPVNIFQNVVANESWDEGLPVPFSGYDPFGEFYRGMTNEVRWVDDENKRQMYYKNLAAVDYILLPSQRSVWSSSRLPRMYPMTIAYYRALFEGRLGFDLVKVFQSPFKIGPLNISDVGGVLAWNKEPQLPRFNFNPFAAEEAFSVYDHPPVWIFKKNNGFQIGAVKDILGKVDLSQVVIQSPRDAVSVPIQ